MEIFLLAILKLTVPFIAVFLTLDRFKVRWEISTVVAAVYAVLVFFFASFLLPAFV